jgi:hypothetical protein
MLPALIFATPDFLFRVYTVIPARVTLRCFWCLHFMNGISLFIKESNGFSTEEKVGRNNNKYVIL